MGESVAQTSQILIIINHYYMDELYVCRFLIIFRMFSCG